MATAFDAAAIARAALGDSAGITWTDAILMPLIQQAFDELHLELRRNNLGAVKNQSARITVPANTVVLGNLKPAGLLDPVSMYEGDVGAAECNFAPVAEVTFLPFVSRQNYLYYWTWQQNEIKLVGCLVDRDIILRFKQGLVRPESMGSDIGVISGEMYIGPRTAALAKHQLGRDKEAIHWDDVAVIAMYKIISSSVVEDQRPIRRRPYRGGWWRRGSRYGTGS